MKRENKSPLVTAGKRALAAVRLFLGACLFIPIVLFMMWVNYTVDCTGIFQGDQQLRSVVELLFSGKDITGYENLNERQRDLLQIMVDKFDPVPETIALGSSRILQLDTALCQVEEGQFFNCALTGADYYDVLGSFYRFDRAGKLPQTIVIGLDPWVFNTDADATDARSDKQLYAQFLNNALGIKTESYEAADPNQKWTSLYSPTYFQDNVKYVFSSKNGVKAPQTVQGNVLRQTTEVKRKDGSLLYPYDFRHQKQGDIDYSALFQTQNFFHVEYYTRPDAERLQIFGKFLQYATGKGVNVILILTPYHPIAYDNAVENADHYTGFMATEPAVRTMAAKYGVPVYGSYNPHAIPGVTSADFYDGIHCTGDCIGKFFPGVPTALENLANGVDVSLDYEITAEEAEKRDSGKTESGASLI